MVVPPAAGAAAPLSALPGDHSRIWRLSSARRARSAAERSATEVELSVSVSVRPIGGVRLLARHEYEEFFGLLVLGLLLLSTLDETALAPIGRAISLACFALLTIANPGAALGVYIGAASIFSVHHYQGQGSWVERPDNYALLALAFYLLAGRAIGRSLGQFGSLGLAVGLLLLTSLAHMASQGNLDAYHVSWFLRMFGVPLLLF